MSRILRVALGTLIVLGALSGFMRAYSALRPEQVPVGEVLPPWERRQLDLLATLARLKTGSAEYRSAEADVVDFSSTYAEHRTSTFLHAFPGALLLLLAPLQFSKSIRSRYIRFHRWLGRFLLLLVLSIGASAFHFGLFMPFGGRSESLAIIIFGGIFVAAAARAFHAIRQGDIARHREWMIRMFTLAIAISSVRLINIAVIMVFTGRVRETFIVSLWLGFGLTALLGEYWIRRTRRPPRVSARPAISIPVPV